MACALLDLRAGDIPRRFIIAFGFNGLNILARQPFREAGSRARIYNCGRAFELGRLLAET